MKIDIITLNQERNVTLTAYIQAVGGEYRYISRRPSILITPGGGYQYCSERESDPVAMAYLKAGYQVFILRYSTREYAIWPNPLDDYEQAMSLIRSKAEEWCLYPDKIAVLGFSAGGHLAGCAATMSQNRPDAAILGYAVTKKESIAHCEPTAPDVVSAVDIHTCPCFVFTTRNDQLVPVENSIEFIQALAHHGVSFESHIYAYGPHGFATGDSSVQYRSPIICSRVPHWVADSISWLKDIFGDFGVNCMTEPVCQKHVTGDYDDFLSVRCTFGYLSTYEPAKKVMQPFMEWLNIHREEVACNIGQAAHLRTVKLGMAGFHSVTDDRTLREIIENTNLPMEKIAELDCSLREIPNHRTT